MQREEPLVDNKYIERIEYSHGSIWMWIVGGILTGAAAGAALGSYFGPVGAVVGGVAGGLAGGVIGGVLGYRRRNRYSPDLIRGPNGESEIHIP